MKSKIKCLLYLRLVGGAYIFIGAFKDPVRKGFLVEKDFDDKIYPQLILPIESILDDNYFVNSQGIVEEREPYCKHCGAKKFFRKDIIGDYFIQMMDLRLELKLRDINVKNVKRNFRWSLQNIGGNSQIIPIK